ncbi:hypothetical protein F8M41_001103 [Gigaspora margarita]|uniref:Peptidase S1 domain-containing protein n=1 Tax=Gigaspora margarita TaxID=4874 RepID=A0A8H3XEX0_GIGMA|nr:hypothetical protein F8M41_001103 [Gigaspora margarita]
MDQAREEPLAELWVIRNQDIPRYLERERFLASGDGIIRQFLLNSSFGETYIDIQPYLDVLSFKPITKSLETLQTSLDQIFDLANVNNVVEAMFGLFQEENNHIIYICSIGFLAKAKNEAKNYILTAEHCRIESGDETEFFYGIWNKPVTNELVGPMLSDVNEHYDFGLIDLSNMSKSLKPLQYIRNTDFEQFPQLYRMPVLSYGVNLCKFGYTTHVTCGFVKAFDVIYYAGDGEFDSIYL